MKPLIALAPLVVWACAPVRAGVSKPSVIFLLADDLGWSDLGCYGHPFIKTPNAATELLR